MTASFSGLYGQSIQATLRVAAIPFEVRAPHRAYMCVSCGSCLNGVYLTCCHIYLTFCRTYRCFFILPHPSGFSPYPTRSSALGKEPHTQDADLLPAVRFYRRTSAHDGTILLQPVRFGKWFRARERYKTLHFAKFLGTCFLYPSRASRVKHFFIRHLPPAEKRAWLILAMFHCVPSLFKICRVMM